MVAGTVGQAVARPSQVDDRRHKMAIAERSTSRAEAVRQAKAQLGISEHHIYDNWEDRRTALHQAGSDQSGRRAAERSPKPLG
jgi:hypothetical protein